MTKLAIKGHQTRGKEIIEILEMLGGKNTHDYICNMPDFAYSINEQGIIDWFISRPNSIYTIFTLEEFLERFPYKVGDKVHHIIDNENQIITDLVWDEDEVLYKTTNNFGYVYVNYLQPHKEETMESKPDLLQQLKEYFDNTPRDILEKEWNELSYLNEIGPSVNEYLECVKKYRQLNQYPKTYEECCKVLMGKTDFQDYSLLLTKLSTKINEANSISPEPPHITLINNFYQLLICRDAYWKIAGEQMGLGRPWEPDWNIDSKSKYVILCRNNNITEDTLICKNCIFAFPTEEMRDTFYENFKDSIEQCKELL